MSNVKFIHLRVHSDFSMSDGLAKPEMLVRYAEKLNMPALAITDENNLYGMIKFYKKSLSCGLKPILGVDLQLSSNEGYVFKNQVTKITALVSNSTGYYNLIALLSSAYKLGYNNNIGIVIKRRWLVKYRAGIILLSGGLQGDVGINLLNNNQNLVLKCLSFYNKYFKNSYYLEITRIGKKPEEEYISKIKELVIKYNFPVVATNKVCFLHESDFKAHKIRFCINQSCTIQDKLLNYNYTSQQFMKTSDQMVQLFLDFPDAVRNTVEISKRCNIILKFDKYFLPKFPVKSKNIDDFLVIQAKLGLEKRLMKLFPNKKDRMNNFFKYNSRLTSELKVINKMGFSGYFLIVMEFINWAKENNIPVGPGRGSGAGSLVSYSLNITEVDPIFFDLLFERFLNQERVFMPDLDVDFCMERRDQVIEHVSNLYGQESVSQIISFGTLTARAVIKDVGRVFGFPYGFLNRISKLVPSDPGITLKKAILQESELFELYQFDKEVKSLINISKKLEGIIRNISKHAGGVVIAPGKITDFVPLYYDEIGNNPITQFDKNDIESIGLVKFDFLGLKTLTIIDSAIKMLNIRLVRNNQKIIDIHSISLNDELCFNFLRSARTIGVFQLESHGMRDLIRRLKPDSFEDLVALVALFRPGPLQSGMVDNFINRKSGLEKLFYPDEQCQHILLKPILKSTYGIILYQEQVMKIAQVIANYSLGNADLLRRAMEKKDKLEMTRHRVMFQEGAKKNGISITFATNMFSLLEKFAGYAFNKSHSVSYALISYQTLWLKVYYPEELMSSAMNADIDNIEKIAVFIRECKLLKLKIIPPDINVSEYYFRVDDKKNIVYGLGAIKGIGKNIVLDIINVRKKQNRFSGLFELCISLDSKKLTRKVIEKLIMSGACDSFGLNRNVLMNSCEYIIKSSKQYLNSLVSKKVDLFGSLLEELTIMEKKTDFIQKKFSWREILDWEKDSLGFYLTRHPVDEFCNMICNRNNKVFRLKDFFNIHNMRNKQIVSILGIVLFLKFKITKFKKKMLFLILEDSFFQIDVVMFDDIFNKYKNVIKKDKIVIVTGYLKLSNFRKKHTIVAYSLKILE